MNSNSLLILGMIFLSYLIYNMTSGYTQMVQELKYLRSKINTGGSYSDDIKKTTMTMTNTSNNTDISTDKPNDTSIKNTSSTEGSPSNNITTTGGGISPQGETQVPHISKIFNSFHLPLNNFIPVLKSVDPESINRKDIYESFNNYVYDDSQLGVPKNPSSKGSVKKLSDKDRIYTPILEKV